MQGLNLGFLDVKRQVQAVDEAFFKLGNATRTFQTNLNTRVSAPLLAVSSSFSMVSASLQDLSKSLTGIAANVNTAFQALYSPKKTKQDALTGGLQTSMKKLHKIFEDLVDISKMDVDSKFSKMSSGIMNISKALAGFKALEDIDLDNVKDQIDRVKDIINSIRIVGSQGQAAQSGADTRDFVDSSVIALQDIGKSITAFGTGIQTFLSDPSMSSILEDAPRLSTMMTSIQSIFETMSGMYKGVQQTILKEDKDGTLTVSTKIQQAVDSRTRALARVSSLLPKFAKAVHQYSVYSKSDTDLALSNIHRFKISVQSLFKAMYGLYGSLIQYTQYGSGEQGYAQEKMVQNFNSATKAMSRVISLLREFNLTILEMAVFDDKDLKKAQATMQQMSRSIVGLFTTMKGLYKSLRETTQFQDKSTGQTFIQQKQIQDFSYATKAVSRVLSLIGTMTNHVKNVSGLDTSKFSSMLAQIQKDLVNFVGTLAKITNLPSFPKFQRLANAMQKVSQASKNLVTATQKSQKALKKLNNTAGASLFSLNRLHPAIRQVFTAFAGYNLIYSAVRALQASIKSMAKLQLSMARVNTITRQSSAVIKQWTKQVINLSARYGVDLQHVSEALYQINSATILGANAFKVLEAATKAAVAGFTDVNKTASLLARAINAYGYSANDAGRLSDILFKTVQRGIAPMQQLSQYMGRIFTVAANAGVSFQQVSAAIATLTTRGLQTNIAVTSLNSAILKLSQGSQALNDLFKEQGYTSSASALQIEGLGGAMRVLLNATNGSTEALTKLGFNYRDIRAVSVLASGAFQQLANNMELMQKASGATDKALEQVKDTLSWKWDQFRKSLDAFILRFNEWANSSSILKGIVDALSASLKVLQDLLNGFSSPVVSGLMFVGQFVLLTKLVPKISSGMKSIGESIKTFKGYVSDARTELQLLQKNSAPKKRQYRVVHTDTPYSGKSKDYAPVWTQQQISMRMKRDAAHMQLENLRKSGQLKGLSEKAVLKAYKDMSNGIAPNITALNELSTSTKKSSSSFKAWSKAVGKSISNSAILKQVATGLAITLAFQLVASIVSVIRSVGQLQQTQKNLNKPFEVFKADLTQVNNAMSSAVAQFSGFGGSIQQRSKQLPFLNKVTDDLSGSISNLQQQCKSAREQGKIVSGQTLVSLQIARNRLQSYIEKIQQFKAQVRSLSAQQRQQRKNSMFIQDIKNTAVQLRNGKQNSNASYYQALRRKQQLKNSMPGLDLSILQHTPEAFDIAAKSAMDAGADFGKLHKVSRQYLDILQKLQKVSNKQLDHSMRDSLTLSSMSVQDYMYKLEKQGQMRFNKNYGFSYQNKSSDFWNSKSVNGLSKEARSLMNFGIFNNYKQHAASLAKSENTVALNFFDEAEKQFENLKAREKYLDQLSTDQETYAFLANSKATSGTHNTFGRIVTAIEEGIPLGLGQANKANRLADLETAKDWQKKYSETSGGLIKLRQLTDDKSGFIQKSVSSKFQSYFKNITDPTAKLHMQAAKLKAGIVDFSDASSKQLHDFAAQYYTLQQAFLKDEQAKKTFQTQVTRIKAVESAMLEGGLEKASKTFDSVFSMQYAKQNMDSEVVERAKAQILGKIQKNIQNFGANYKDIIEDIDSGMSEQFIIGKYAKNLSGDALQKFIQSVRDQRKAREDWFNRASQALSQNTASMVKLRNINVLSDRAVKYAKDKVKQIESQMFTGADGTKRSFDEIQKMFDRNRQIGISDAQTTQQLQESGVIQKEQMARLTGAMLNWSKHMTVVVDSQQVDEKNKQIKIPEAIQAQTAMAVGSSQFIHTLMSQTTKTPEQVALDSINKSVKRITKYVTQTDGSIAVVYA